MRRNVPLATTPRDSTGVACVTTTLGRMAAHRTLQVPAAARPIDNLMSDDAPAPVAGQVRLLDQQRPAAARPRVRTATRRSPRSWAGPASSTIRLRIWTTSATGWPTTTRSRCSTRRPSSPATMRHRPAASARTTVRQHAGHAGRDAAAQPRLARRRCTSSSRSRREVHARSPSCAPERVGPATPSSARRPVRASCATATCACSWRGMLTQPTVLFGLPPARGRPDAECELRGDDALPLRRSRGTPTLAADAADPERARRRAGGAAARRWRDRPRKHVRDRARPHRARRRRRRAATRIIDRAATAVRAPSYLVAVRAPAGDRELHVHHARLRRRGRATPSRRTPCSTARGDAGDEHAARRRASPRRPATTAGSWPSRPAAASSRTSATCSTVYAALRRRRARHRDRARRRPADASTSRARCSSSRSSLAAAPTRARRSPSGWPRPCPPSSTATGCAVFLWDDGPSDALTCHAVHGRSRATADELLARAHRLRSVRHAACSRGMVDDARPAARCSSARDATTPFVARHPRRRRRREAARRRADRRQRALLRRPQRQRGRPSPSACARPPRCSTALAGVVAQAATALDNARLLETMAHQARHDNLTGLLGHRAFHEALDGAWASTAGDPPFTLAADRHRRLQARSTTHTATRSATRRCATSPRRCAAACATSDAVFRVGGEEFAVLLPGPVRGRRRGGRRAPARSRSPPRRSRCRCGSASGWRRGPPPRATRWTSSSGRRRAVRREARPARTASCSYSSTRPRPSARCRASARRAPPRGAAASRRRRGPCRAGAAAAARVGGAPPRAPTSPPPTPATTALVQSITAVGLTT